MMNQIDQNLYVSLPLQMGKAHRLCRDAVSAAVESLGLTQPRWTALVHISLLNDGPTQLQLANSLGIEMPSLTRTLQQLEQQDLIERRIDDADKRSKKIYFTEQGQQLFSQLEAVLFDIKKQLFAGLSDEQIIAITKGLSQIERNAQGFIQRLNSGNTEHDT